MNTVQNAGFCGQALDNINPDTGVQAGPSNFYQTYCAAKPNVACMYAESGAAYHPNDTGAATQLAIQSACALAASAQLTSRRDGWLHIQRKTAAR